MVEADVALFPTCPLCGTGSVMSGRYQGGPFRFGRASRAYCNACGGEFQRTVTGGYRYVHCNPHRVAELRRLSRQSACADCAPCQLGESRSVQDWTQIAGLGWPRRLGSSSWPGQPAVYRQVHPTGGGPTVLSEPPDQSDVLHVAAPAYVGEPSTLKGDQAGELIVTASQIVFVSPDRSWSIPLQRVAKVRAVAPGMELSLHDDPEPIFLTVPDNDGLKGMLDRLLGDA